MSAEAGTCYRNSAYRRSLFDHYAAAMTGADTPADWQGNFLADCLDAQSAAGITGALGQLYDPDGTWPQTQGERVTKERQQVARSSSTNSSLSGETHSFEISDHIGHTPTVNIFTAPQSTRESFVETGNSVLTSMAIPGETYGQLTESDMHSIIHEAQDRAQVIALQIARDIGWTMPSLISSRERVFQTEAVEFPLAPVPRMIGR